MISGSIELWSDCEIYGEGSKSIIKKIPAITQKVTKPADNFKTDQRTFIVEDATEYQLGYDCCVCLDLANYRTCLQGKIANIDIENNTITVGDVVDDGVVDYIYSFNSYTAALGVSVLFSTSFSVFCAYSYNGRVENVYIHDLVIDGNRQKGTDAILDEPFLYPVSTIHMSDLSYSVSDDDYRAIEYPHDNIRIENLNIQNSPADGISIQSSKDVSITNCVIENCGFNAIHLGVGTNIVSIVGCKLNADYCGYFDCMDVGSVSLTSNHFENCLYGIGGIDPYTNGLTVTANTFRGCSIGVCAGLQPYPDRMSYLKNSKQHMYGHISQAAAGVVVSDNTFYGITKTTSNDDGTVDSIERTGIGVQSIGGTSFVVLGNTFHNLDAAIEIGCAKYIRIANNYIRDCNTPLLMVAGSAIIQSACGTHTINSAFTGNMIQAGKVGAHANIDINLAKNMLVTGNTAIGSDARVVVGDDTENIVIDGNNINGVIDTSDLGDISTALDRIIELQEELIGA